MRELATVLQKVTLSFFMRKKRSLFMKDKKYKNETRNKEMEIVKIYQRSIEKLGEGSDEAKRILNILKLCFKSVSVFTNLNHDVIADRLYFCKQNLFEDNLTKITDDVSTNIRSLDRYRKKYGRVIDIFLEFIQE